MLPEMLALGTGLLLGLAEWLHARRVKPLAALAFGSGRQPARWTRAVPYLRVLSVYGLAGDLAAVALDDALGRRLQDLALPAVRKGRR